MAHLTIDLDRQRSDRRLVDGVPCSPLCSCCADEDPVDESSHSPEREDRIDHNRWVEHQTQGKPRNCCPGGVLYLSSSVVEEVGFQYTAPAAKTEARHPNTTMIQILLCWSVLNSDGISKISAIPDNASPMMHVAHNEFLLTIAPSLTSLQVKRLDRRSRSTTHRSRGMGLLYDTRRGASVEISCRTHHGSLKTTGAPARRRDVHSADGCTEPHSVPAPFSKRP